MNDLIVFSFVFAGALMLGFFCILLGLKLSDMIAYQPKRPASSIQRSKRYAKV